ncbi:Uncharacterized conserved protein, DUF305 family [Mycolicibacterium rutilum]|uniref:Uncharacterized conserved protein, DUF305 family n=1 Tax=Mycolicibacterium rutilum TaxID=370526 RepID=A0A1H6ITS4_MYCRU|nr:DUF305 domain-containing protein [Mycolicibacterium rutilum]SEH52321.1 Uncharacterized conserved protein, DUF305 family [Mycolicibacterium rutilum]
MSSLTARLAAVLLALATALLLSSCSSPASDGHTDHEHPDEPVITGEPAGYNADDVSFATNMIPHHEQAVELSALVPERSTNPEVKALAEQISGAQGPEIQTMKVLLVQWKENPDAGSGHEGHGADMQGMVDEATMTRLKSLTGAEFDTLWLQSMISHHQGAIEMAKAELANGENVDAKRLAQTIVDTQQAEINQMNQMLGG